MLPYIQSLNERGATEVDMKQTMKAVLVQVEDVT